MDAASFQTGNRKRDTEIRSAKYLDVTTYPDITFEAQQVAPRDGRQVDTGKLTAHGVSAPVDLALDEVQYGDGSELLLRAST